MVVGELQSAAGLLQWLGRREAEWQEVLLEVTPLIPSNHRAPVAEAPWEALGVSGAERAGSVALCLAGREVTNV